MIDFETAIATIRDNNGFVPNHYDDSYYRVYNTSKGIIQVRISNHGTHLWTWVKNVPVNPSMCIANICIVLSENGFHNSSTTVNNGQWKGNDNNPSNKLYDFEVIQYVYNCSVLSNNNGNIINKFIQNIPQLCRYEDPMKTNQDRHAGVFVLHPNQEIRKMVTVGSEGIGKRQLLPQNTIIDNQGNTVAATKWTNGADETNESKSIEPIQGATDGSWGYKTRSFNTDAF